MCRTVYQAKNAFTYAALFDLVLVSSVLLLGVLLVAHSTTLHPKELMDYIVATYATYPAFKGLLAIGVVAFAMSTAASFLNSAAVLFVHDIVKPLQRTEEKKKQLPYELTMARFFACGVGLLAWLLTFTFQDLLNLLLISNRCILPIYVPAFLLAIFGFRSTPTIVVSGMALGGITVVLWRMFIIPADVLDTLAGLLANGLVLLISPILLPKPQDQRVGWIGVQKCLLT